MHDLRHTFASLLIAGKADVKYVSQQLGHSDAGFTLRTYTHLFDKAAHAEETRQLLQDGHGNILVTVASSPLPSVRTAKVVPLPRFPCTRGRSGKRLEAPRGRVTGLQNRGLQVRVLPALFRMRTLTRPERNPRAV
jgi:Phage integrase family